MKAPYRIIALILLVLLSFSLLASCGGSGETTPATTPEPGTTAAPKVDKWESVDFTGKTLNVEYSTHTLAQVTAEGAENFNQYLVGPDDYSAVAVANAVFERNNRVYSKLGFEINFMETDLTGTTQFMPHFESVSLAEIPPDVIVHQHYGLVRAAVSGLLYNLREDYGDSEKNFFDFDGEDSDNWYMNLMESTTLNKEKLYIAASDFLFDSLRLSYNVFVNVDMFSELFSVQGGMDYLYNLVLDPQGDDAWTYDKLQELTGVLDGFSTTGDDVIYGAVSTASAYRSFFYSSGLEIFDYDENGTPSYIASADAKQALHNYVDKMMSLYTNELYFITDYEKRSQIFQNGKALFMTDQFLAALEGSSFLNMDDAAGVLPFPKYDTSKEYSSLVADNACSGAILYASQQFRMATASLQMMTEESDEVRYQYFDQGLKLKNNSSNDARQVEVLDIIHAAVSTSNPLPFLFDNLCSRNLPAAEGSNVSSAYTIYDIIQYSVNGNTNIFSSVWDSEVTAKNNELQRVIGIFNEK